MPKHTPQARLHGLMTFVGWTGDPIEFSEMIPSVISAIADPHIKDAMMRYYGGGRGTQRIDAVTGKPDPSDSRFYQHLEKGRVIFKTIFNLTSKDYSKIMEMKQWIT